MRIAKSYARTYTAPRRRLQITPAVAALAGAAAIALIWLLVELL